MTPPDPKPDPYEAADLAFWASVAELRNAADWLFFAEPDAFNPAVIRLREALRDALAKLEALRLASGL